MKLKQFLNDLRISYKELGVYCGTSKKIGSRWANGELPNALIIAYNIEKLSKGKVTMQSLAEEAIESQNKNQLVKKK